MVWEEAVIKCSIAGLTKAFYSLKRKGLSNRDRQLLSAIIAELRKIDPEFLNQEKKRTSTEHNSSSVSKEGCFVPGINGKQSVGAKTREPVVRKKSVQKKKRSVARTPQGVSTERKPEDKADSAPVKRKTVKGKSVSSASNKTSGSSKRNGTKKNSSGSITTRKKTTKKVAAKKSTSRTKRDSKAQPRQAKRNKKEAA